MDKTRTIPTPDNCLRAIKALREPDAAFARVPNTVRQSTADIIEGLVLLHAADVGKPSKGLTVENVSAWMRERLDNCHRIAAMKAGADRQGWLDDATYFSAALDYLARPRDGETRG